MAIQLYIESLFNPNFEKCEVLFEEWLGKRNALQREGKNEEAMEAQEKASLYYELMYSVGYFRDKHETRNLLALFGLEWEIDVIPTLIVEGWIPPAHAKQLLTCLTQREPEFEKQLAELEAIEGWSKLATESYFRDSYQELKDFLNKAIELDEVIMCSMPNL